MDQIRCDEPSYLIWKWHPAGVRLGEGNRENAIRWGSSLRVKDGEVAVFVYHQKDGTYQDFIEGPFDQKIKTANFPVLAKIVGLMRAVRLFKRRYILSIYLESFKPVSPFRFLTYMTRDI